MKIELQLQSMKLVTKSGRVRFWFDRKSFGSSKSRSEGVNIHPFTSTFSEENFFIAS